MQTRNGPMPSPIEHCAPAAHRLDRVTNGTARFVWDGFAVLCGTALAWLMLGRAGAPMAAVLAAGWWVAVVAVVRSDLERFIIPDSASIAIAALGAAHILAEIEPAGSGVAMMALASSLLNGVAAFGLFWLVRRLYRKVGGREGLGFGDVKLAGASAIWLEPGDAALALEIAALAALAVLLIRRRDGRLRDTAVPFGAFLAPAAWLTFVAGPTVRALLDGFP